MKKKSTKEEGLPFDELEKRKRKDAMEILFLFILFQMVVWS
jgi:hypothetical protein